MPARLGIGLHETWLSDQFFTAISCLACSVKDRIAYNMINKAEEQGIITPGKTILVRDSYQGLKPSNISVTVQDKPWHVALAG